MSGIMHPNNCQLYHIMIMLYDMIITLLTLLLHISKVQIVIIVGRLTLWKLAILKYCRN